jgi:hypothetical protein
MRKHLISIGAALGALTLGTLAHAAPEAPAVSKGRSCFASNQWESWTADPSGDTLYLRVRHNDVYRVDLSPGSRARKSPSYFLVNRVHGSNWICSALDLNLDLTDNLGFRQPLIALDMRKMSPQEVAALPKKLRP